MMSNKKTIALGSDHAGYSYKKMIIEYLEQQGYETLDFGTTSEDSVDYPDYIHPVADAIENNDAALGLIFCGSGNGVAMTANKHAFIRAAIAWSTEIAALARQHNNANILAIPARFADPQLAKDMVDVFLNEGFEGGRHQRRVSKIPIQLEEQ